MVQVLALDRVDALERHVEVVVGKVAVGACADLHELDARADGVDGEVDVLGDVARLDEGIERGEERARDVLEARVGVGEGGLE